MALPETCEQEKAWLEANIGPVKTSRADDSSAYVSAFENTVFHHDGSDAFPIEAKGLTPQESLSALFHLLTSAVHRFNYIQFDDPVTRRISVDRNSLQIIEMPIPGIR